MKKILLGLSLLSALAFGECTFERDGEPLVKWTAYKTPAKKAVSGSFRAVSIKGSESEKSLEKLLVGTEVFVQTNSVDSKNGGRDVKLVTYFFNILSDSNIKAKITVLKGNEEHGNMFIDITMNSLRRQIPMSYSIEEGMMMAVGYIDLSEFKALHAIDSINRACFELHEGKTWSDVKVEFKLPVTKVCSEEE